MDALTTFLKLPVTEIIAIFMAMGFLQRMGVDVMGLLKSFLKIEPSSLDTEQLSLMRQLKGHYNDETTGLLEDIKNMAEVTKDTAKDTQRLLQEIKEYGIKCRPHER